MIMDTKTDRPKVLIIGATGMIGRPVTRRLLREGFPLRALVRDIPRAKRLLGSDIEFVKGDVRQPETIASAMRGMDAVYINLSHVFSPRRRPKWDPDADGSLAVLREAEKQNIRRIARTSAGWVDKTAHLWWAARAKAETDKAFIESSVPATIFGPTWLMESLPRFLKGRKMLIPNLPDCRVRWLAGDDLGRQVAAAFLSDAAANRVYIVQGPEYLNMEEAARRFAAAHPENIKINKVPVAPIRLAALFSRELAFILKILDLTDRVYTHLDRDIVPTDLPRAEMRIEDYVQYMLNTADIPGR